MAIIKIGAPLTGIRGTIGGITYSANAAGPFAKQWARGSNPKTPKQSLERSYLAQMSSLWSDLSDPERASWRTFASDPAQELTNSLGVAYFASGFNWFVKCTIRLFRVGRSPLSAIPTQARPSAPAIDDFVITQAGSDPDVAVGGTASASSSTGGFPASQAFDDDMLTRWRSATTNPTGWLQYVLPSSLIITGYSVAVLIIDTIRPMDWTFERLDPGPIWTVLHTITSAVFTAGVPLIFYFPNSTPSTTYRINISANAGFTDAVNINEMQYFLGLEGSSRIVYPANEFTDSPDYDLILKISQGQTPARIIQYPGFTEILALQGAAQSFELFQDELTAVFGTIALERSWFARLYRQTREGLRSAPSTQRTTTL